MSLVSESTHSLPHGHLGIPGQQALLNSKSGKMRTVVGGMSPKHPELPDM